MPRKPKPTIRQSTRRGLYIHLTPDRAEVLDAYERRTGTTAAVAIRHALAELLHSQDAAPTPARTREYTPRTARQTLRLTQPESELLKALAARHHVSAHTYIVGLLRTGLLKAPQPTEPEIAALDASTRQLQAIGVNLNQVVRRLNETGDLPAGLADAIAKVKNHLSTHTAAVDTLIKASQERWT